MSKLSSQIFVMGLLLFVSTPVFAGQTIPISDDDSFFNCCASLNNNGEIAWVKDLGLGNEIWFYDGNTDPYSLTKGPFDISGSWSSPQLNDHRQAVWSGTNISFYDGSSIKTIPETTSSVFRAPGINNKGQIAWVGTTFLVDNNGVSSTDQEIYFYDGSNVSQLTNSPGTSHSLSINDNYLSWGTSANAAAAPDIYLYHIGDAEPQRITNDPYSDFSSRVSSDGRLAWVTLSGPNPGVNIYNGKDIVHLADFAPEDLNKNPFSLLGAAGASSVAWSTGGDIYMVDPADMTKTLRLTNTPDREDAFPSINAANQVVWSSTAGFSDDQVLFFDGTLDSGGQAVIKRLDKSAAAGFSSFPRINSGGDVVWDEPTSNSNGSNVNQVFLYDASRTLQHPEPREAEPVPSTTDIVRKEPARASNDFHGGLWSMQTNGTLAGFEPGVAGFNPDKPTVVLVHGWEPANIKGVNKDTGEIILNKNFPDWVSQTVQNPNGTAQLLGKRSGDTAINVLAWNWLGVSSTSYGGLPQHKDPGTGRLWPGGTLDIYLQANALAMALNATFEENYHQPIQFIGHSLGGDVITLAARFLDTYHGRIYNVDQLTLFDVPKDDLLKRTFLRGVQFLSLNTLLNDATTLRGIWVDNYPTIFGGNYSSDATLFGAGDIVNFQTAGSPGANLFDFLVSGVDGHAEELGGETHAYPMTWYFGLNDTNKGTLDPKTGLPDKVLGAYLSKVLNESVSDHNIDHARFDIGIKQVYEATDPQEIPSPIPTSTILEGPPQIARQELGFSLKRGEVSFIDGVYNMQTASPVFLFDEFTLPEDSKFLMFDFKLENPLPEDELVFFVGKNQLFRFSGNEFDPNWDDFLNSGPIDVAPFAGTDQWLTFLYNSDQAGHRAQITNIDLFSFELRTQPTVTPEPASMLLFGLGAGALGLSRRFRKKSSRDKVPGTHN